MSPKKTPEKSKQVAFRLPMSLIERLDAHAERLSREQPGMEFTRVDVVRVLLTGSLEAIDAVDEYDAELEAAEMAEATVTTGPRRKS